MPSLSSLLAVAAAIGFFSLILFVIFGQLTVRKLRKDPITKNELGMEYVSGWDIINIAQALTLPSSWSEKLSKSQISFLYANAALIKQHTNKLDKVVGMMFYISLMTSGLSMALLALLDTLGFFD
ncbi:hypothetical protein [Bowmanella denitrificans]|uniref:hypothetical protein n=1 Tax=Bowmanella denitrificans TaxID=366582 RepID=UPI000C9D1135|nr:hypothetical protein [Bowmanella denitrificans]